MSHTTRLTHLLHSFRVPSLGSAYAIHPFSINSQLSDHGRLTNTVTRQLPVRPPEIIALSCLSVGDALRGPRPLSYVPRCSCAVVYVWPSSSRPSPPFHLPHILFRACKTCTLS